MNRALGYRSIRPAMVVNQAASKPKVRAFMAALVLMYIAALLWNFRYIVGEHFEYMGFLFSIRSAGQIGVTILFALLPILWLPLTHQRPSVFLYLILYLTVYVPACVVPAFTEGEADLAINRLQLLLAVSFALVGLSYRVRTIDLTIRRLPKFEFWMLVACLSGLTMMWIANAFGLRFRIHSFADVYDIRENHSEIVDGHNRLLIYLLIWHANVMGPLLIAYAWLHRNLILGSAALIAQVWIYSVSGYKTFLLALPFVGFVMWLGRFKRSGSMMLLLAGMLLLLVTLCSILDYRHGGFDFSTTFVRRLLLTPGRQTFWYYEFFSENPKVMLSHSVLATFIEYPYEAPPPALIGHRHFGTYSAGANGNIWADAYANFGAAGMLTFSGILGVFCWAYDCAANKVDYRVALALLAMPTISLCNSALLTSLLTHGLGLALLVMILFPRGGEGRLKTIRMNSVRARS